jgi:hypothetical protein
MVRANGHVRDFYESLKIGTADVVRRIFITGISPVMLDDLTSGFNIADNLTLDLDYNEMMGFTQQEVTQLMHETGVDPNLITVDMEKYYNGYLFHEDGLNRVYNPAMILFFFKKILKEKRTPKQLIADNLMVDYGKIERLIASEDNENVLINIVKDKGISAEIIRMFSIDRMYSNEYFISLLFYMGLLTIDGCYDGDTRLKIPNYSIQTLYWDFLVKIIAHTNKDVKIDTAKQKAAVKELAFKGNPQPFFEYVSQNIFSKFSNRDLIRYDEKYIKAIVLCCSLQNNVYVPLSEVEVGTGYIDVFLHRGPQSQAKFEWVWELKYIKDKDANMLPARKQDAINQLNKYRQADLFKDKTDVKYAAVVFVGKDKYEVQEVL